MKKLITALTLTAVSLLTVNAFAASNSDVAVPYTYSQHLDVAKVLSMSQIPDNECGVVPATMKYQDSKGDVHTISYQVLGNGCDNH